MAAIQYTQHEDAQIKIRSEVLNMKVKVRILIFTIVLSLFFVTPIFASGSETPRYYGYGQESITRELTAEERARTIAKEQAVLSKQPDKSASQFSTGVSFELPGFNAVRQEKTIYCGPASSLALLDYRWATPSQDALAANWDPTNKKYGMNTIKNNGTTSPDMARSINHHMGSSYYVASKVNNTSNLASYIRQDVGNDYPVNLLVDTKYFSWYNGKSLSHFVTVFGYYADVLDNPKPENIALDIADPHYNSTYFGKHYAEPFQNAFKAINANSWRENVVW